MSDLRGGARCGLLLLLVIAGCSGGPKATPDGGGGGSGAGGACATGKSMCQGTCVDTATDPKHCGQCDKGCGGDEICSGGSCVLSCVSPRTACGAACVNTATSHDDCGSCGNACGPAQICSNGSCSDTCPEGQVKCGGGCVDPALDLQHCGASAGCGLGAGSAGAACAAGQRCAAGVCACAPGWLFCNGACVDPSQDRDRCGATTCSDGVACGVNQVCAGGACTLSCPAGLLKCNGKCVDPQADPTHCGATADCDAAGGTSGKTCAAGELCSAGSCALSCQTGLINCNGICVDPSSNRLFCGATSGCGVGEGNPGTACAAGEVCSGGKCTLSCQTGMLKCGGACVDPATSRAYCGATGDCTTAGDGNSAGATCASGNLCVAGACGVSCPTGSVDCGGVCVNPSTDNGHCGAAGNCTNVGAGNNAGSACTQGRVCNNGACAVVCQPGLVNCGGVCIDPGTSVLHCGASGTCTNVGGGNTPGVACPAGNLCVEGNCVVSCPAGSVNCGGVCVNPQADNSYCGASGDCTNVGAGNSAGHACAQGRVCNSGVCAVVCAAGLVNCNGTCVDPQSDSRYCGAAGNCTGVGTGNKAGVACAAGSACTAGACAASCADGLHACSNMCVDWTYNPNHCGGCGVACSSSHIAQPTCFAGTCNGTCDAGYADCDGNKLTNGCEINSAADATNCGGCSVAGDHDCNRNASGGTCSGGICGGATCKAGYANCDGLTRNGCETSRFSVGSSGAPGFAQISNYLPLDGVVGDIGDGASIPASIGTGGIATNWGDGMAYTEGQVNQALQLDGWNDSVDLGVAVGNFGTADFSISMWIRTSPRYDTQWILTKRAYCTHAPFWNVGITWDGHLIFEIDQDYDGTNYGNINGTTNVLDNAWHHIAFVRQNTAMRIYVDGNLDGSGISNGVTNLMESYNVRIGQISCAWGQNFGGLIDDVAIWTGYALTQAEAALIACVSRH